jgi:hypothetical protein
MKHIIKFQYEKSTKNTHRYEEVPENGQPPKIKTMYVQKWVLPDHPATITVTIE